MRIAFIGDMCNFPVGYGKQIHEIGRHLLERGHEVGNFALQHLGPPRDIDGIEVVSFSDDNAQQLAFRRWRPDVAFHIRDNWVLCDESAQKPYHLRPIAGKTGSAFIAHTPIDTDHYPQFWWDSFTSEADHTTVTTDWGVKLAEDAGVPMEAVSRWYPGVNHGTYRPGEPDPTVLEEIGLPTGKTLFVQVATNMNNGRKMHPRVLWAFRTYLETVDPDAMLFINSPAIGFFALEEHAHALGLTGLGRVALRAGMGFTGHVAGTLSEEQMGALYRSATALISLSTGEGFDSPFAEAMSTGIPTVVTDFPVHREVGGLWEGRNPQFYVPASHDFPTATGFEWWADVDRAVTLMEQAAKAPHGMGGVPDRLQWRNLALEAEAYAEKFGRSK